MSKVITVPDLVKQGREYIEKLEAMVASGHVEELEKVLDADALTVAEPNVNESFEFDVKDNTDEPTAQEDSNTEEDFSFEVLDDVEERPHDPEQPKQEAPTPEPKAKRKGKGREKKERIKEIPRFESTNQAFEMCVNKHLFNQLDRSNRTFYTWDTAPTSPMKQERVRVQETGRFWQYRLYCRKCNENWTGYRETSREYECPKCGHFQFIDDTVLKPADVNVNIIVAETLGKDDWEHIQLYGMKFADINLSGHYPKGTKKAMSAEYDKSCIDIVKKSPKMNEDVMQDYLTIVEFAKEAPMPYSQRKRGDVSTSWMVGDKLKVVSLKDGQHNRKMNMFFKEYVRIAYIWTGLEWIPAPMFDTALLRWRERAEWKEYKDWADYKEGKVRQRLEKSTPEHFGKGSNEETTPTKFQRQYEEEEVRVDKPRRKKAKAKNRSTVKAKGSARGARTRARLSVGQGNGRGRRS